VTVNIWLFLARDVMISLRRILREHKIDWDSLLDFVGCWSFNMSSWPNRKCNLWIFSWNMAINCLFFFTTELPMYLIIQYIFCWWEYKILLMFKHNPEYKSLNSPWINKIWCYLIQIDTYKKKIEVLFALSGNLWH